MEPPPAEPAAVEQPPPVDMERLLDFANGNPDNLRELVELYLQQTERQVEQLCAAVQGGAAEDTRRLAHSCAGASSTCGMAAIGSLLRELERQGAEGLQPGAAELAQDVRLEFERIRAFLENYLQSQSPAKQLAKTDA